MPPPAMGSASGAAAPWLRHRLAAARSSARARSCPPPARPAPATPRRTSSACPGSLPRVPILTMQIHANLPGRPQAPDGPPRAVRIPSSMAGSTCLKRTREQDRGKQHVCAPGRAHGAWPACSRAKAALASPACAKTRVARRPPPGASSRPCRAGAPAGSRPRSAASGVPAGMPCTSSLRRSSRGTCRAAGAWGHAGDVCMPGKAPSVTRRARSARPGRAHGGRAQGCVSRLARTDVGSASQAMADCPAPHTRASSRAPGPARPSCRPTPAPEQAAHAGMQRALAAAARARARGAGRRRHLHGGRRQRRGAGRERMLRERHGGRRVRLAVVRRARRAQLARQQRAAQVGERRRAVRQAPARAAAALRSRSTLP